MSFILASPAPTPATNSFFFLFGRALGTDGEKSACALLNGCLANENFYIYIYTAIPRK